MHKPGRGVHAGPTMEKMPRLPEKDLQLPETSCQIRQAIPPNHRFPPGFSIVAHMSVEVSQQNYRVPIRHLIQNTTQKLQELQHAVQCMPANKCNLSCIEATLSFTKENSNIAALSQGYL
ncbi:hypothetical protein L3Q82_016295 [Scortum barcoo]|uniref:Uncharacterized protein n=1 Tax=Scortum barcoo TaxID=214431 RepID=A0ACB8VQE8_9TELE|nr:hypothetical protein L3Q82_016295 [Scortum barcoo]